MLDTAIHLFQAVANPEDPYASKINQFFQTEFPTSAAVSKSDLLDILTAVLLGTNNTRYGPMPCAESQVAIREVIRQAVTHDLPIPVLVPWGGRKTVLGRSVDVAEVVALKQLSCLQAGIKNSYLPGLQINIRIEDTGASYLYRKEGLRNSESITRYSMDFQKLVRILNLNFINPIRESDLMDWNVYENLSDGYKDALYAYINESDAIGFNSQSEAWKALERVGWKGEIPQEQRDFYRKRYVAHEPGLLKMSQNFKLAEYFAGSLARYKLGGTADSKEWNGKYIQISFVPVVPGAPTSLVSRNIYYRTIPEKMSRTHMPAWRSAGFFRIFDDKIVPGLASFHQLPETIPQTTKLTRAGEEVEVQTDYLLER